MAALQVLSSIEQTLLPIEPTRLGIRHFSRRHASQIPTLLEQETTTEGILGVAVTYNEKGQLDHVFLSTRTTVYTVNVLDEHDPVPASFKKLFCQPEFTLVAFRMAHLAISLQESLKLRVRGADLSTLYTNTFKGWPASKFLSDRLGLLRDDLAAKFRVDQLWHHGTLRQEAEETYRQGCLRAWISVQVGCHCLEQVITSRKVDTSLPKPQVVKCLAALVSQNIRLAHGTPKRVAGEVLDWSRDEDGRVKIVNARYRTRVRKSNQARVIITDKDGRETYGYAVRTQGRSTTITQAGRAAIHSFQNLKLHAIGEDEPPAYQRAQDELLLMAARGEWAPETRQFIRWVFLKDEIPHDTLGHIPRSAIELQHLNASQRMVVKAMISECPIVVTQGPPGTGKTSVIAETARIWQSLHLPTWIVAQSNVAVKNIAEKLIARNIKFKIIVSKEFYVEWHEHIYEHIVDNLLRSDDLPQRKEELERMMTGVSLILSTLSMLSNPAFDNLGMFELVPVYHLIVDEASQIDTFQYLHLFYKFKHLKKACFFGDPQQLPPHGQDKVPTVDSIFSKIDAYRIYFLGVQYRMPALLGEFISQEVYDSRLQSIHPISDPSCLRFVDTGNTELEQSSGFSWTNASEIRTIVHLIKHYYRGKKFCVITPYDAQRAAIERALKAESLPWECVYNVDSFQGNEEDYVIISVVRTRAPGFLGSLNRMNVMLTRCKKGMVIVSSRAFLEGTGRNILIGKLARFWENRAQGTSIWVDWRHVATQTAHLPGAPGRSPPLQDQAWEPQRSSIGYIRSQKPQIVSVKVRNAYVYGKFDDADFPSLPSPTPSARSVSNSQSISIPKSAVAARGQWWKKAGTNAAKSSSFISQPSQVNTIHRTAAENDANLSGWQVPVRYKKLNKFSRT